MKKIGIGIDYSNICKDYNTSYLDRDNNDPATKKCMKQVVSWTKNFLSKLTENFDYNTYALSSDATVKIDDIASNRFLFYSLEKDITLQSYVIQKEFIQYDSLASWGIQSNESVLVKNDEDGEGIYLYFDENSQVNQWIVDVLQDFSLEEVPFQSK